MICKASFDAFFILHQSVCIIFFIKDANACSGRYSYRIVTNEKKYNFDIWIVIFGDTE